MLTKPAMVPLKIPSTLGAPVRYHSRAIQDAVDEEAPSNVKSSEWEDWTPELYEEPILKPNHPMSTKHAPQTDNKILLECYNTNY